MYIKASLRLERSFPFVVGRLSVAFRAPFTYAA